ncbi:neutral/alkaline non-lysosomal ceramidase N-terminal domain-containing protein [Actinomadura kijaniata]|uniref:Neutral ceramidase n=1 Tax=Actinomadura namibiensis TaxID=182080 RepID=A0A7W3LMV3_ACTNM|nr:neutral/alkaline non-lysosomal ceramidase N-terminal domain-containing protein [Actinomadura namibiensis]MBA8951051.1 neutral ceramidase [Actinomadura namibiensis]
MTYLAGRGIADVTGEAAECGMLGYGMKWQVSDGIHTRLRARAFAFERQGGRALLVVCDLPLMFDSVVRAVLPRLPDGYDETNVMITATHTHCGPGGYARHALYNSTAGGFRDRTFGAIVDGIVEAATRAHEDLAPARLLLGHGELRDASVNRSRRAFDRNPAADRAFFPDAIDPQVTVLRIEREGRLVGAVSWFATHNTSLTNRNTLISGDNKGYASYHWERLVGGVDYLDEPGFVAAFPQTNAGDMSPNLWLAEGRGPTDDQWTNARLIGERQYRAATAVRCAEIDGPIDARLTHVDMGNVLVRPEFTGDGRPHRTGRPVAGASAWAGAGVDGPAFKGFREGRNPVWDALSRCLVYPLAPRLRDAQYPKAVTLPAGVANRFRPMVAERFAFQLLRIGPLYLVGIPGEVTIVAGLRLRRAVAGIVGAELENVLVAGYSNGYMHYTTTPEEYDAREYEGGSTLFGRWQLPALCQIGAGLATAMRDGAPVGRGTPEPEPPARRARHTIPPDRPHPRRAFGDVLSVGRDGRTVTARFVGAHPGNDLRRGGTYLAVERRDGDAWTRVADDGDWCTTFRWARTGDAGSTVTITWDVPEDAPAGRYRIRYLGDTPDGPFTGATDPFEIP